MRIDAQDAQRLRTAIGYAFTNVDALRPLVQVVFGKSLDQITLAPSLEDRIFDVVQQANNLSIVALLLDELIKARPSEDGFLQLRGELAAQAPLVGTDYYDVLHLRGGRVMVNRRRLRAALRELCRDDGKRILVVKGPPSSGKTYSLQLITYLQQQLGRFKVAYVDLKELEESTEYSEVRPEEIGEQIAIQMNLCGMPKRAAEQDARWVRHFCDWLTGQLSGSGTVGWIVVDSFTKAFLPQGSRDLIRLMAKRLTENLHQCRLILLSYDDEVNLPTEDLELEDIGDIGEEDLIEFFAALYRLRQERKREPFADSDIVTSVVTVSNSYHPNDPGGMRALGAAVLKEATSKSLI
jgi:hypothetical protein